MKFSTSAAMNCLQRRDHISLFVSVLVVNEPCVVILVIHLRAAAEGKSLRRRCMVLPAMLSTLTGWLPVGWSSRLGRRLCMLGRENMKRHLRGKG